MKRVSGTPAALHRPARPPRLDATGVLLIGAVASAPWTGVKFLGLPVADVLLLGATATALASVLVGRRSLQVRPWTTLPAAAAFAILAVNVILGSQSLLTSLLSTGTSSNDSIFVGQGGGLLFVLRTTFATLVMFVLVESEIRRRGSNGGTKLLEAFVWGTAVSASVAVYTEITGKVILEAGDLIAEQRAWGLAFHPNSLGQSLALAIPAIFCIAAVKPRGPLRGVVSGGLIGLFGWGLVLADSRGALAIASAMIALLVFVALYRATGAAWVVPAGIFLGIGLVAVWPSLIAGTRLAQGGLLGLTDTDEGRREQLQLAWQLFAQNPFVGVGPGQGTGVMVPAYLLSSGGLVLFLAFCAFIWIGFRAQWRLTSPYPRAYTSSAIATLVLMGLPNNSVNERFDYVTFSVVVASALVLGSTRAKHGGAVSQSPTGESSEVPVAPDHVVGARPASVRRAKYPQVGRSAVRRVP